MSKKMKLLPFLFKNKEPQWPLFPSCAQYPKTQSFRGVEDDVFKTVNSIFLHDHPAKSGNAEAETPVSWFTSSSSDSTTTTSDHSEDHESLETVLITIRGVNSKRLFFEPNENKSLLITNKKSETKIKTTNTTPPLLSLVEDDQESMVMVAIESEDPYRDFKTSMEEMVKCYKMREWECLEELLAWYLKVNGKKNHGLIVGAFLDLLVGEKSISTAATTTTQDSSHYSTSNYSSALSSFPSQQSCDSDSDSDSPFRVSTAELESFEKIDNLVEDRLLRSLK